MNINTSKIKYVIAREGLIIISLLICMVVSLYVDSWKKNKINEYARKSKEVFIVKASNPFDVFDTNPTPPKQISPLAQFPQSTQYDVINRTMNKDYPKYAPGVSLVSENSENLNISARYDENGNKLFSGFPWDIDFINQLVFYLFLAYPAYLIIRFIVWASSTVRNARTESETQPAANNIDADPVRPKE